MTKPKIVHVRIDPGRCFTIDRLTFVKILGNDSVYCYANRNERGPISRVASDIFDDEGLNFVVYTHARLFRLRPVNSRFRFCKTRKKP